MNGLDRKFISGLVINRKRPQIQPETPRPTEVQVLILELSIIFLELIFVILKTKFDPYFEFKLQGVILHYLVSTIE